MNNGYYSNTRFELYSLVPNGVRRVLDIGCAAGGFKTNFPENIEYWGVEPVEEAAKVARAKGINTLCGSYDAVSKKIPDGYFDVVCCNDVIEHIFDTAGFLKSIATKLRTGGCVIGSIPNVRFVGNLINLLIKRDWRYEDSGILDNTHVRFFTRKSFARSMKECGYNIEVLQGIESNRMRIIKKILAPVFWIIGSDICDMQIMFKASKR